MEACCLGDSEERRIERGWQRLHEADALRAEFAREYGTIQPDDPLCFANRERDDEELDDVNFEELPLYQVYKHAVDTGISDLAHQHDHYLYGAEKSTSAQATSVWIEDGWVCLRLSDEREIRFPARRNQRLRKATPEQLAHVELICDGTGVHWEDLDEDLSVQGILEGRFGQENEVASDYLEQRARRASWEKFRRILDKVADVEPAEYDKLD